MKFSDFVNFTFFTRQSESRQSYETCSQFRQTSDLGSQLAGRNSQKIQLALWPP